MPPSFTQCARTCFSSTDLSHRDGDTIVVIIAVEHLDLLIIEVRSCGGRGVSANVCDRVLGFQDGLHSTARRKGTDQDGVLQQDFATLVKTLRDGIKYLVCGDSHC